MTYSTPIHQLPPLRTSRRVLQVITPSHMSGAEMQLVRLTRQMQARGHQFSTAIKRGCPATAEMWRLGIDAKPLAIGGKLNVLAIQVLAQHARQTRAELIQSTLSTASWWSGWLERLSGLHDDRPRARLHVRPLASPAVASARRVASGERRPGRAGHCGRADHGAPQRAGAGRIRRHGAIRASSATNSARRPTRPSSARSPTFRKRRATATCSPRSRTSAANFRRRSSGSSARASSATSSKPRPAATARSTTSASSASAATWPT